jgi:uncharacterized membrane protein YhfC
MTVHPMMLLPGVGMIVVGIAFIIYWRLSKRISIVPFLLGAIAWFVAVALKLGFALLFNGKIQHLLSGSLRPSVADPLFWLYIGLLTGVFECGLVLALWRQIRKYDFNTAVAFGIGFGAIESILLGVGSLIVVALAIANPASLPRKIVESLSVSVWAIPAPIVERIVAVFAHIFSCVLIIRGAERNRLGYFWIAFVYKSLIDAVAAWAQLSFKVNTTSHVWTVEAIVSLFGIAGFLGLIWLSRGQQTIEIAPSTGSQPSSAQAA